MEKRKDWINSTLAIFLLASLSCFLWGSATPSIKKGYELFAIDSSRTLDIILFAGIRFFLAGILVILFHSIASKRVIKPEKGSAPSIIKLAFAQTILQYFCFYIGLAHTSGVAGTIISGASGFFSILLVSLVFRYEKMTGAKILGCILGLGGIIIMNVSPGRETVFAFSFLGEGLVLLSTICLAMSGIMVKKYSKRFDVVMLSGYQFIFGGFFMIVISLILGGRIALVSPPMAYILMLYMAMISAVAYSVWSTLLKYNDVSKVTIFSFMTPLFGVFLSAIFLGETEEALKVNKLIALILVCLGIFIVNRKQKASA